MTDNKFNIGDHVDYCGTRHDVIVGDGVILDMFFNPTKVNSKRAGWIFLICIGGTPGNPDTVEKHESQLIRITKK
jgi:hypothetical protein